MNQITFRSAISAFFMFAIGAGLIVFAPQITGIPGWPAQLSPLLPEVGVGLIASAILTVTLESLAYSRLFQEVNKAIQEIRKASIEKWLEEMVSPPIFTEIRDHIIRQPFLRTNLQITLDLSWKENRSFIKKTMMSSYEVENISRRIGDYHVICLEERLNEDRFPGCTRIKEITVTSKDSQPRQYLEERMKREKLITESEQVIKASIPIRIKPGESVSISSIVESVHKSEDIYPLVVAYITNKLTVIVTHPEDLEVRAVPMHPSEDKFIQWSSNKTKRWVIDTGLLPYQGIEISWRPVN